ncbi:MAG: response regulator [Magnetococcales bacterium]|nr:response regulator [Magnetococcales bacterium]
MSGTVHRVFGRWLGRLQSIPSLQVHFWLLAGMVMAMFLFFGTFSYWLETREGSGERLIIDYHLATITHCIRIDIALADMQLRLAGEDAGSDLTEPVLAMERHLRRIQQEMEHIRRLEDRHDVNRAGGTITRSAEARFKGLDDMVRGRLDEITRTGRAGVTKGKILAGMVEALRHDITRLQMSHGFLAEAIHKEIGRERNRGWPYLLLFSFVLLVTGFLAMRWIFRQIRELVGRCAQAESASREACSRAETANAAKSRFLANISHEIRTPLNAVLGIHDLLVDADLSSDQKHYLEVGRKSAETLLRLVSDLLDISKVEAGGLDLEMSPFRLIEMIDHVSEAMRLRAQQKGVHFSFAIDQGIPEYLVGDSFRLQQVLFNLVGNAVKFTDRGSVDLRVRRRESSVEGVALEFEVCDTGIGIPTEKLEGIFQVFTQVDASTTRRFGGTGLGLAISRRLVEMMGGTIHVESQLGRGSRFWFDVVLGMGSIDMAEDNSVAEIPLIADHGYAGVAMGRGSASLPWRLLVVDDSDDNRLLIQAFLKNQPYRVDTAGEGATALEKLRLNRYDLVLMDLQMPVLDGLEATRLQRQREKEQGLPRVPILALTAHAMEEDERRALQAGCDRFLTKPIRRARLLAVLGEILSPAPS